MVCAITATFGLAVAMRSIVPPVPQAVNPLARGIGAVLGQAAMDAKSNEIAAVRDLLKAFTDLAGAVITIDALHTQAEQVVTSVQGTFRRPGPDPADDL